MATSLTIMLVLIGGIGLVLLAMAIVVIVYLVEAVGEYAAHSRNRRLENKK